MLFYFIVSLGCIYDIETRVGRFGRWQEPGRIKAGRNVADCHHSECQLNQCQNGGSCVDVGASFRYLSSYYSIPFLFLIWIQACFVVSYHMPNWHLCCFIYNFIWAFFSLHVFYALSLIIAFNYFVLFMRSV